jgi:hypothetical protein
VSILNTLITLGTTFTVVEYTFDRGRGRKGFDFLIKVNITVPVDLFSEELWYAFDNEFKDPLTQTEYTKYDTDGDEDHHWGLFSINLKGPDIGRAAAMVTADLEELVASIPPLL